jgi:Holliday junction resolvase RusA-like endonuclease
VDDNPTSLNTWREDVKLATLRALRITPGWEDNYPLIVGHFTFTLPRPKAHYRAGNSSHLLRPDAPMLHGKRPDLDKLLRSTWDALTTSGAYLDDNRVARVTATKCFPNSGQTPAGALPQPGAWIHLQGLQQ